LIFIFILSKLNNDILADQLKTFLGGALLRYKLNYSCFFTSI